MDSRDDVVMTVLSIFSGKFGFLSYTFNGDLSLILFQRYLGGGRIADFISHVKCQCCGGLYGSCCNLCWLIVGSVQDNFFVVALNYGV